MELKDKPIIFWYSKDKKLRARLLYNGSTYRVRFEGKSVLNFFTFLRPWSSYFLPYEYSRNQYVSNYAAEAEDHISRVLKHYDTYGSQFSPVPFSKQRPS